MTEAELTTHFEAQRDHLRRVAYRLLGTFSEADDALQEAWLRAHRAREAPIDNVAGWLTTIVARVCLNQLRDRAVRRDDAPLPDPLVTTDSADRDAALADSVSLALLVVLDTLSPAERVAFVLHDLFEMPFDDIAPMVGRTSAAARQLASRARRRVRSAEPLEPDVDLTRQREVVQAFFEAARSGAVDALIALLAPDVVLRAEVGGVTETTRGAAAVAGQAFRFRAPADLLPALVNGAAGVVVVVAGRPFALMGFIVRKGLIVEIDAIADPQRVARLTGRERAT